NKMVSGALIAWLASGPAPARAQQQSNTSPSVTIPAPPDRPALAQDAGPASVIRSSSDLVRIDVEVTDKSGKPVKGLTGDKFSITDNGKPQNVSVFAYEDIEAVEQASPDDSKPIVG